MTTEKLPESVLEAIGAYGSAAEKYPDPGERAALEKLKAAILAALESARNGAIEECAKKCEVADDGFRCEYAECAGLCRSLLTPSRSLP